ncbi:type IV secretory system conjugative DNA transfer family protein [Caulobacter sp. FWC26]|uniref:type IV secretory system conjugative DNA transfer family protein n=1 Tax=Caulobacter sp. FWC26 TaxID=69665 RepID=UPI000C148A1A|nr:type IV secretory system conjugative DNA transfer family protein [Caulobacter sp. FWC26]AZS21611.1 conjugal transfer protein TraG [Caulobacter sp. FWC26]
MTTQQTPAPQAAQTPAGLVVQYGEVRDIPLNRLKASPKNVRRVGHSAEVIESRAASISHKGVLQPLVVEPEFKDGRETGYYLVSAGEGRRQALRLLAKRKALAKGAPVRCVVDGALERRSHWDKTSHSLLVGAILHVLYAEEDKTLAGVANFLADPRRTIEATLRAMMATPHLGDRVHPVVASAARELLNKSENERSGVLSTAMSFLGLYRDPIVSAVTSRCDWWIDDLVTPGRPVTLYLVVPPSDISRTRPLIRLILNQIGRRLTEGLELARHRPRLLLMLDEFPALGRLDFFEQAMAFMAGYRIKAFLIAQSLNQIAKAYGENNSILDNCHVRVAFSTNDERTARRISDSLGTATEMRAMKNYAGHRLSPWLGHLMVSRQETARPLLTPGEVMQLPADEALVQVSGVAPIRASKVRYYLDQDLKLRVSSPPRKPSILVPAEVSAWAAIAAARIHGTGGSAEDASEGGLRLEPELDAPVADAMDADPVEPEVEPDLDADESVQAEQSRRFRAAARIAALDPDDGIPL